MYIYDYEFDKDINYWIKHSNNLEIDVQPAFLEKLEKINWNTIYIGICSGYFSIENIRKFIETRISSDDNLIELIIEEDNYNFFELIEKNAKTIIVPRLMILKKN